jgi:predicted nucleic acid-binding protein
VIYVDTSVALAHLLTEARTPFESFWDGGLVSSRLLGYELWTRLHARGVAGSHGDAARRIVGRIAFVELTPNVLARALEPFPAPVRTLDSLHLASVEFLRARGQRVQLASYDKRLVHAARALGIEILST